MMIIPVTVIHWWLPMVSDPGILQENYSSYWEITINQCIWWRVNSTPRVVKIRFMRHGSVAGHVVAFCWMPPHKWRGRGCLPCQSDALILWTACPRSGQGPPGLYARAQDPHTSFKWHHCGNRSLLGHWRWVLSLLPWETNNKNQSHVHATRNSICL